MQIILHESDDIAQTVAIPVYNAKEIAWLCMEGLCNQDRTEHYWEIIMCEEPHDRMIGKNFILPYVDRLREKGCKRIVYIDIPCWIPLPQKWKTIGENAHVNSKSFLLQAVDCYSPSVRLNITYDLINSKDYQWIDFNKGYFYSFEYKKIILYQRTALTNLNMAYRTEYAKYIPYTEKRKGIDKMLYRLFKVSRKYTVDKLYEDSLDTDGFNSISKRNKYFINPHKSYIDTDKTIDTIGIPEYIKKRIKKTVWINQ